MWYEMNIGERPIDSNIDTNSHVSEHRVGIERRGRVWSLSRRRSPRVQGDLRYPSHYRFRTTIEVVSVSPCSTRPKH